MLRVAFAGTSDFAIPTLEAALRSKYISVECIYSQPDRPSGRGRKMRKNAVALWAIHYDIPLRQPASLKDPEETRWFISENFDALIVVAYGQILEKAILNGTRLGCFNLHASLLPRWRGAAPLQRAIEAGDLETGATIMLMDTGLDTGPVLSKTIVPLTDETTTKSLQKTLSDSGGELLVETLIKFDKGKIKPTSQPNHGITYAKKISVEQAQIKWNAELMSVLRHIHAFNPVPGAYTFAGKTRLKIFSVEKTLAKHPNTPGVLWSDTDGRVLVSTASGVLELTEVQLPGGQRIKKENMKHYKNAIWHKAVELEDPQP